MNFQGRTNITEKIKELENQHYDIIITDYKLPGMGWLAH